MFLHALLYVSVLILILSLLGLSFVNIQRNIYRHKEYENEKVIMSFLRYAGCLCEITTRNNFGISLKELEAMAKKNNNCVKCSNSAS